MSQSAAWSDDRILVLSTLWRDGLSASQIARQLGGVTRNAVIGKIHRLGLSGRDAPSKPSRAPRRTAPRSRRLPRAAPPVARRLEAPAPPPEGPGLVDNLVALGRHACKWPIGDPKRPDFTFCGRLADGRYCVAHERQAVRAGAGWRIDQDPVVRRALAGLI